MTTSKEIDLLVRVKTLEKLVDRLQDRCDEAVIQAKQSENLMKQALEIVAKMQTQFQEKEVWDDTTLPPDKSVNENDDLGSLTGAEIFKEPIKQ